jgi:peptidoglycan/LPS O-acetylase OafA/YrhL
MKGPEDPVDHARTTRPHAGETMKDNNNMPALALLGLALVSFIGALTAQATANHTVGNVLGCLAAVLLLAAGVWFRLSHRRVRKVEDRWHDEHPDTERQQPTS